MIRIRPVIAKMRTIFWNPLKRMVTFRQTKLDAVILYQYAPNVSHIQTKLAQAPKHLSPLLNVNHPVYIAGLRIPHVALVAVPVLPITTHLPRGHMNWMIWMWIWI